MTGGAGPRPCYSAQLSNALARPMTIAEFLAWEERQELRWEFDGERPVAMTGSTVGHETIGATLRAILRETLRGGPCRVFGPTLKIEVAGRIRYPDAFVTCTPASRSQTVAAAPVVVFEVLSAGTSHVDRLEKLREYRSTESIRRYVIFEQDTVGATIYARAGDVWTVETRIDGDTLDLPEIGVAVPLTNVYADVDFADGAGAA